jgi:putative iron-dependent peroxidase
MSGDLSTTQRSGQAGVLADVPAEARYLTWSLVPGANPAPALARLARLAVEEHLVLGVGAPLAERLGRPVPGLSPFPGDLPLAPTTQGALWVRLAHPEAGRRFDAAAALVSLLGAAFHLDEELDAFMYRGGRDLSGFEDGTENPRGADALAASVIAGAGPGLDGGSFVALQRWVHDLAALGRMPPAARDNLVGRSFETNEELEEAPPSAHVKRTAQESFTPPAHMVRRSMPYGGQREHGLYFVAFVESLARFERMLRRMAGMEDGVLDGLFAFSRPITGGYYLCPPVHGGRLDLRALGL